MAMDKPGAIISTPRDILYRVVSATQPLWYEWGHAESLFLASRLSHIPIEQPVYVTGLARAGTTMLLELLASHPQAESHRYKDFPFLPIIYSWRRYLQAFQKSAGTPQERSHRDGLLVTADSPEAFEEMLWMRFFPHAHNESHSAVLDSKTCNAAFEVFYRNHIRALLLASGKRRYAAKGNYNITRMAYLRRLFPDARFIIGIRHPVAHIASLMKQHRLLGKLQRQNPALLRYMRQAGHFEFGLDRRIIRLGSDADTISQAWNDGREVEGWARYWNSIYHYLMTQMQNDPALAQSILVVPYETLCAQPEKTLTAIFAHARLPLAAELLAQWKDKLHLPDYYRPEFTADELQVITHITGPIAAHFGYEL